MTKLKDLKVPGPTETELTSTFWRAAEEGRLQIQQCEDCGVGVFYPRDICPHCWSGNLKWAEVQGTGRLKSYSTIHKPGHPGWVPAAPYFVGLVELDEGPTMLSHILSSRGALTVGERLRLKPTNIGGRILPAFETTEEDNTNG